MENKEIKEQRGIQSIEVGGSILLALADFRRPVGLSELAKHLQMPAGKAHPYLVSFSKLGITAQDPRTGYYSLGPTAIQLGLASLQMLDPVREAGPVAEELAADAGHGVSITIWGNTGPTVVRVVEPHYPLYIMVKAGSVMSLVSTSTGRLFAAYMPARAVQLMLASDERRLGGSAANPQSNKDYEDTLAEIRRTGLSIGVDKPLRGISSLAAPVFDYSGNIVLVLTLIGPTDDLDVSLTGPHARKLKEHAARLSSRLGATRLE